MTSDAWSLSFDNHHLHSLPIDPIRDNYTRQVSNAIFSLVTPTPVRDPKVVVWSPDALALLGVNTTTEEQIAAFFSGNVLLPGSETAAHCYAGHQFGSFAGQLGDGAAISLGQVLHSRYEIQLKGAGATPYSRRADGRKVLRSSLREFLASEAMAALGIPTTRAASCIVSTDTVVRDVYYDGHAAEEPCSVVARISPSPLGFFRIGSLEIFLPRGPSAGNEKLKNTFIDHLISYEPSRNRDDEIFHFFSTVFQRSLALAIAWQNVGFVHGVMNTDNISLAGLTIDYGPYGFLEGAMPMGRADDPDSLSYVPNGSDTSGRYSFAQQGAMMAWNMRKLAEALAPQLPPARAQALLDTWPSAWEAGLQDMWAKKLGLLAHQDQQLVADLLALMDTTAADFTDTFVALNYYHAAPLIVLVEKLVSRCATPDEVVSACQRALRIHRPSMPPAQTDMLFQILQGTPQEVQRRLGGQDIDIDALRNEIAGERRILSRIRDLNARIQLHRDQGAMADGQVKEERDRNLWTAWVKRYREQLDVDAGIWMQTHEGGAEGYQEARKAVMKAANPTIVLRAWMAEDAIKAATAGDYAPTRTLHELLREPYREDYSSFAQEDGHGEQDKAKKAFLHRPPKWANSLLCTCSS